MIKYKKKIIQCKWILCNANEKWKNKNENYTMHNDSIQVKVTEYIYIT